MAVDFIPKFTARSCERGAEKVEKIFSKDRDQINAYLSWIFWFSLISIRDLGSKRYIPRQIWYVYRCTI